MPQPQFSGSMTARQFAKAAKETKLSPKILARARRVLVDGESVLEVAKSEGVAAMTIYAAIWKAYLPD